MTSAGGSSRTRARLSLLLSCIAPLAGCGHHERTPAAASASATPGTPLGPPVAAAPPRKGMVWIPGGALVAGTPPNSLPRIADEEMPGEQVILKGFYIDRFPYPDEDGAIPLTGVDQARAKALCEDRGERLCSELEWERACKGPDNKKYEYGNQYRADRCGTGLPPAMRPTGVHVACRSDFGVRDMHGGVWEWTDSPWGRGTHGDLVTLRGGNAPLGLVVGRCANGMGRSPSTRSGTIGFRCCAGPRNDAEVVLKVRRGRPLTFHAKVDKKLAQRLVQHLPDDARTELHHPDKLKLARMWTWRPIGNERLIVMGGCDGAGKNPECGVLVVRVTLDRPNILAWASSGHWMPVVRVDVEPRDLWLFGGNELGSFRRLIAYAWGRVDVGSKERKIPRWHHKSHH